ncbi:MAG: type IV pilus assembly protein PilM [Candidatus Moranbacteria bacterium]|nr:type IV pilus assembly protein PilM [Candidatus Moranbacteria bacterium]
MFGFGKSYFLGVDFGTASIKAVELSVKGNRPVLENYAYVSLADLEKGIPSQSRSYDEEIVLHLKALLEQMRPKSKTARVAMPAFSGLVSLAEFPLMDEAELQEAVRFEAHKYIPSPLDEVALSWEVVGTHDGGNGEKKMEVLLVAALNKEVVRYEGFVRAVDLKLDFLELETFSIARSIIGNTFGLSLLIDIGSRATNLVLIENGLVKVSRNLDVGGRDVTRVLAEGLNITLERAKMIKKGTKDYLNDRESSLVFPSLQRIASEAERILTTYQTKHSGVQCNQVVLSGGTAHFVGLLEYYEKILKLPVVLAAPWKNIEYDPKLEKKIQSFDTSFSVALGLALSGAESVLKKEKNEAVVAVSEKENSSFKGFFSKK